MANLRQHAFSSASTQREAATRPLGWNSPPVAIGYAPVSMLCGASEVAALPAASLQHTDRALDAQRRGASTGRLLECAGLGLTVVGALR